MLAVFLRSITEKERIMAQKIDYIQESVKKPEVL